MAWNYSESAQIDDESCIYSGCMDENACNYNPEPLIEDYSCEYESCAGCMDISACNFNSEATIEDNTLCDFETCAGCMDESADNYDSLATIDGGNCIYDCVDGEISHFGHSYELVLIGSQCWFAENLRADRYDNGDSIPEVIVGWPELEYGARIPFGLGGGVITPGSEDFEANFEDYGFLYNWFATVDSRGLCPSGFHVPDMEEWAELKSYINDDSYLIRSSSDDEPPWNGSNVYGFSALPGGRRSGNSADYYAEGLSCYFWSQSGTKVAIHVSQSPLFVNQPTSTYQEGYSVRCIRD